MNRPFGAAAFDRAFVVISAVLIRFSIASDAAAQSLFVEPDCPNVQDVIDVGAIDPGGYVFGFEQPLVSIQGNVVRVEARLFMTFPEPPPSHVRITVGRLPVGSYRFELWTRVPNTTGWDPARLAGTRDFQVYDVAPACGASELRIAGASFLTATVGEPYDAPIVIEVVDAHGLPARNANVMLERLGSPAEPPLATIRPDLSPRYDQLTTWLDGVATFSATANLIPGTFQYRAYFRNADRYVSAYVTLYNAPLGSSHPDFPVVEFYNGLLLHYFLTGDVMEMTKLDHSLDWQRTGGVIMAFAPGAGGSPVCRFYGLPEAGLDSHFFSASAQECNDVRARFGRAWTLETDDAFRLFMPDIVTGACPPHTTPVYRAYNNLPDANHRYSTDAGVLRQSPYRSDSLGWTPEGYGPDAVVMCAPQ